MNNDEILLKVNNAFTSILKHENFTLTTTTKADDVDGWESVTHMMIIVEIEKNFNIKFKLMDLMAMENIGDLLRVIKSEIAE